MRSRGDFLSPHTWEEYIEHRQKLGPELAKLYDSRIQECDCDYGSSGCRHFWTSPKRVAEELIATREAVIRDYEVDL